MQAFGPYAQRQVLDFRLLRGRSLFVIHGPIGAGKTSILDAICFALYGVSSGGERSGDQLRSSQVAASVVCRCILDFEVGGKAYRVERMPDQERPKKVGEGTTLEPRSATLWGLPEAGDPRDEDLVTGSWSGVNRAVERLLGVRSHQFCQAAVLPQGQFRRFLLANNEEREEILATLFATRPLLELQERLRRRAEEGKNQLKSIWKAREALVVEAEVAGADDFYGELEDSQELLRITESAITELENSQEQMAEAIERATLFRSLSEEREHASRDLRLLEAQPDQRQNLKRARKAHELLPYREELERSRKEVARCEAELLESREALREARQQREGLDATLAAAHEREEERFELKHLLERLETAGQEFEELAELEHRLAEQQQEVIALSERRDQLQAALALGTRKLKTADKRLQDSATARADAKTLRLELEQSRRQLRQVEQYEKLTASLANLRVTIEKLDHRQETLEERVVEITGEVAELEQERLRTLAWQLAEKLVAGDPCPVCGSQEHPQLCQRHEMEELSETRLEHRQAQLGKAQGMLARHLREKADQVLLMARLEERLEGLQEEFDPDLDWEELNKQVTEATQQLKYLEQLVSQRPKLLDTLDRLKKRQAQIEAKLTELAPRLRQAEKERDRTEGAVLSRREKLDEEFANIDSIEESQQIARQRLAELEAMPTPSAQAEILASVYAEQLAETRARELALETALGRVRELFDQFSDRLEAAGFVDEVDLISCLGESGADPTSDLQELEARLEAARDRLERAETALHKSVEPADDLHRLRARRESSREELRERMTQKAELENKIHRLEESVKQYNDLVAQIQKLDPEVARLRKLARVARGDNKPKLSFHAYLLARLFARVLASANGRLALLTRGRYRLMSDPKGFGLEIYDRNSGANRSVTTLSGGESFLASLALALGLADTVRASDGEARLETMFIDEGFGNLDTESLELAIQALMSLEEEGRLIGVISHVDQLNERIDARLEVRPGPRGSRAEIILD